jgi:hypothetical protein
MAGTRIHSSDKQTARPELTRRSNGTRKRLWNHGTVAITRGTIQLRRSNATIGYRSNRPLIVAVPVVARGKAAGGNAVTTEIDQTNVNGNMVMHWWCPFALAFTLAFS